MIGVQRALWAAVKPSTCMSVVAQPPCCCVEGKVCFASRESVCACIRVACCMRCSCCCVRDLHSLCCDWHWGVCTSRELSHPENFQSYTLIYCTQVSRVFVCVCLCTRVCEYYNVYGFAGRMPHCPRIVCIYLDNQHQHMRISCWAAACSAYIITCTGVCE